MAKEHEMQEMDTFWSKTGPNMEKGHEMQEMDTLGPRLVLPWKKSMRCRIWDTFWSKTDPNMAKEHEMQEMGHFLVQY
jgi:hypothetical protein